LLPAAKVQCGVDACGTHTLPDEQPPPTFVVEQKCDGSLNLAVFFVAVPLGGQSLGSCCQLGTSMRTECTQGRFETSTQPWVELI